MARITSLIVLAVLVVVIGLLSFEVLSMFILPLFLAGMTAVIFKPVHLWLTKACGNRPRVAAALTTGLMLMCVLLPTLIIGLMAAGDAATLFRKLDREELTHQITALQNRFSLGPPPAEVMQALDHLEITVDDLQSSPGGDAAARLQTLQTESDLIAEKIGLPKTADAAPPAVAPNETAPSEQIVAAWRTWTKARTDVKPLPTDAVAWKAAWGNARNTLMQFRVDLLGGPIAAWFKQNIHIEPDQLQAGLERIRSSLGPMALGTTQFVAGLFVQLTLGLVVMLLGLYYFLADGREMLDSMTRLTPLDGNYFQQLTVEFGNLTRAIVLSMLLSAAAQGLLALPAYWFCGVGSVFLLTMLTAVFAMVPFVGATAIWGSCAAWLVLVEGKTGAGIGLAIYGITVIAMADNLIKPLVLHGRSNLHPLPALLSVIGGVEALGPIGVFVGPMVVALLHTVLVMLRNELNRLDNKPPTITPQPT